MSQIELSAMASPVNAAYPTIMSCFGMYKVNTSFAGLICEGPDGSELQKSGKAFATLQSLMVFWVERQATILQEIRMMSINNTPDVELEMYRVGEEVPYGGQYAIVAKNGDPQDFDPITLDEGDIFPQLKDNGLCYLLVDPGAVGSQSHELIVAGPVMTKELPEEDLI